MQEYKQSIEIQGAKIVERLENKLGKLSATGAQPAMLNDCMVNYHGEMTPLLNIANVKAPDALSLVIVPYENDKKVTMAIIAGVGDMHNDLNAVDQGHQIRVSVPPVDGEKRSRMAKEAKEVVEASKIQLRQVRQDVITKIKKSELSDDLKKDAQAEVQKSVDTINNKMDDLYKAKEKALTTV